MEDEAHPDIRDASSAKVGRRRGYQIQCKICHVLASYSAADKSRIYAPLISCAVAQRQHLRQTPFQTWN